MADNDKKALDTKDNESLYQKYFELSLIGSAGTNPRDHEGTDAVEAADQIATAAVAHLTARAEAAAKK